MGISSAVPLKKIMEINIQFLTLQMKTNVLKKYTELWDGIKNEIETINGGKKYIYSKDFMKIKFNTDDNLPLNKPLKFYIC